MKVVGKKDLSQGKSILRMLGVYFLCLVLVISLFFVIKNFYIIGSGALAVLFLVIERTVALIKFKKIPFDIITMHRDHVEIKINGVTRIYKYIEIKNIIVDLKHNKMTFEIKDGSNLIVKHVDNMGSCKKEILDYKRKYF